MRTRAIRWLLVATLLVLLRAADAGAQRWQTAFDTSARGTFPRQLTEDEAGRFVLWTTGARSRKYTFDGGAPSIARREPVDEGPSSRAPSWRPARAR